MFGISPELSWAMEVIGHSIMAVVLPGSVFRSSGIEGQKLNVGASLSVEKITKENCHGLFHIRSYLVWLINCVLIHCTYHYYLEMTLLLVSTSINCYTINCWFSEAEVCSRLVSTRDGWNMSRIIMSYWIYRPFNHGSCIAWVIILFKWNWRTEVKFRFLIICKKKTVEVNNIFFLCTVHKLVYTFFWK